MKRWLQFLLVLLAASALAHEPEGRAFSPQPALARLRWNEQLGWTYDAAGNLSTRKQNHSVPNQTFTVNAANELTNVARLGLFTVIGLTAIGD